MLQGEAELWGHSRGNAWPNIQPWGHKYTSDIGWFPFQNYLPEVTIHVSDEKADKVTDG